MHTTTAPAYNITGRFTLPELTHLVGTMTWNNSVPELRHEDEEHALQELVRQATEYMRSTENAVAVDIIQGQIVNVVTG